MTLSYTDLLEKADLQIRQYGESPIAGSEIYFQQLAPSTPPANQPYYEDPNPSWGPQVQVIAWLIKKPMNAQLEALRQDLVRLGVEVNKAVVFYVSAKEAIAKNLGFSEDLRTGRFIQGSESYTLILCKPSSHVQGKPLYWRVATEYSPGGISG